MQQLKAYCHTNETLAALSAPLECHEVSFLASPSVLRELAAFFVRCADKFDEQGHAGEDHFHRRDDWKGWAEGQSTDVIAVVAKDGSS